NLSSSLTINARDQDIWLGEVVGPFDIRLNSDGETRLMGKIGQGLESLNGSIFSPTGLVTDSTGTTVFDIPDGGINSANIQINGDLILNDDILLADNTSFLGSYRSNRPITFNGTLNTHSSVGFKWLFFNYLSSSGVQFNKNVGEEKIIKGIEIINSGVATINLNLSKFITDSTISLPTKVVLNSPTKTVLIENTTIFNKKIGLGTTYLRTASGVSPNKLIVKSAAGQVSIRGPVGNNNQPLLSLSMISPTNVVLGGSSITTTLSQDYTGDIKLAKNVVLNSPKIAIQNNVDTAEFDLTINTTNRNGATKIEGVISGSGDLIKNGIGYLDFNSINTLTGNVVLNGGRLNNTVKSDSIFPNAHQLSIASGATANVGNVISDYYILDTNQSIVGNGLLAANLFANSGSTVSPGLNGGLDPGKLSLDKINMASGSTFSIDINGTTVNSEYDQLVLTEGGSLGGATLDLTLGFNPMIGDTFKIVTSDSSLSDNFAGLPEGAEIISGNYIFNISYANGSGSDVELTVVDFLIIHVDANAAQGGDGASWDRAFNNLQDALAIAGQNSEIWVADGTYYPDEGGGQVDNDRIAAFTLVDGVSVYGGFNGTETELNQRDPETNITVLSGDITQDDDNSDGNNILEDRLDANGLNSYHIVNGSDVDTSTVFSGFIVTAGQADGVIGSQERFGAGMYCGNNFTGPSISMSTFIGHFAAYDGAATYGCSQDVVDSDFINNYARNGGAILIRGGNYENVLFQGNTVYGSGGAISKNASPLTIINSQFIANQAFGNGGAISSANGVTLENVLFSGNKSNSSGGAINQNGSNSDLTNVTMTGNLAVGSGGAININNATLNVRNSIIWNNHDNTTDTTASSSINLSSTTFTQTNSMVQNFGTSGVGNLDVDPLFITNTDPTTAPTALGNARLQYPSMSIDTGDNSFVTSGSMDLDNTDRIFNGIVDMGAYESSSNNTVSVSVTGLGAGSLVLQNKGDDNLTFTTNGTQVFMTPVTLTDNYLVTVYSQPTSPSQECVVANPTGTINGLDVTVSVNCTTNQYKVGINVSGLVDGVTLSLLNNAESLDVTSNGSINFATAITDGEGYDVSVVTNPTSPNQECLMTSNNASGSLNGMDVVIDIECTTLQYNVGVDVSGLADGVILSLLNNGDALDVTSDGQFNFSSSLDDVSAYAVSITSQPTSPNQECLITSVNQSGNLAGSDVVVEIECTTLQYNIGVDVSGLADGVTFSLLNNSEALDVISNGQFNFSTALDDVSTYAVSITSQPTSPNQECLITSNNAIGDLNGMDVVVGIECTTLQYNVGVDVSGLADGVTLSFLNNAEALGVISNGQFNFATPLDDVSTYAVSITSQPTSPNQECLITSANQSGNLAGSNVVVEIECTTLQYNVGVDVSGLADGVTLSLLNNNEALDVTSNGQFNFSSSLDDLSTYAVSITSQPTSPNQECLIISDNANGSINGLDIVVDIECTTLKYTVGINVSGLADDVTLIVMNNSESLNITSNGRTNFVTAITDGDAYDVSVLTNPTNPNQECLIISNNAMGNLNGMDLIVDIECTTLKYNVGVEVSGLAEDVTLSLLNNSEALDVTSDGQFNFSTALDDDTTYAVSITSQPTSPNQECLITSTNAAGDLSGSDVIVTIECSILQYNVGVDVSGLADGVTLTLMNNSESLDVTADGLTNFASALNDSSDYSVSIETNPKIPNQECLMTSGNATGMLNGSDVIVKIECTTLQYNIRVDVSGLADGVSLKLQNNQEILDVTSNGIMNFDTALDDASAYAVSITSQPTSPNQECLITSANASGNLAGSDEIITIECTIVQYTIGVNVSGLTEDNTVELDNNGESLIVIADGQFNFPTALDDVANYNVIVTSQPTMPNQMCTVESGIGTLQGHDVILSVTCSTDQYFIGGIASGLANGNTVSLSLGSEDLNVSNNDAFIFFNPLADESNYSVLISNQPTVPNQTCDLVNPSGIIAGDDVDDIQVNCTTNQYTIGGFVTGLHSGNNLVIQNNDGDDLIISYDGDFDFASAIEDLESYDVSILNQPTNPIQACELSSNTGNVAGEDVIIVIITCEFGDDLIFKGGFDSF
ncbi:MAG: beta strand repeat-containing protein, partial [Marinicellaceae bacterium]